MFLFNDNYIIFQSIFMGTNILIILLKGVFSLLVVEMKHLQH